MQINNDKIKQIIEEEVFALRKAMKEKLRTKILKVKEWKEWHDNPNKFYEKTLTPLDFELATKRLRDKMDKEC